MGRTLMWKYQQALPWAKEGEKWVIMKPIFELPKTGDMNLEFARTKYMLITGGASGIGEAVCKLIAGEGGIVVIADRNGERSTALANEIIEAKTNRIML